MKTFEYYYLAKRNLLRDAADRIVISGHLDKKLNIHVSGACGKAMASVACMLSDKGYKITTSDESCKPPMSDVLRAHKIKCLKPSKKIIKNSDLVVAGNFLTPHAEEMVVAKKIGAPMISGAEIIKEILIHDKKSLIVAGTHGKTTTSALLAHIFEKSGQSPAYLIGGSPLGSEGSYSLGNSKSKYAILEGDEYDCAFFDKSPKFLRYKPTSAIITSIEHDHMDLYPTFSDYIQAFQFLVEEIPESGFLLAHESIKKIIDFKKCHGRVFFYGKSKTSDWIYKIDSVDEIGTYFTIFDHKRKKYEKILVPLFGEYNIENVLSAFALSFLEKIPVVKIISAISDYCGVKERQEMLGQKNGKITIRDFAHHPTAVRVTLNGLRQRFPKRKIICVFEPRSITSRRKIFEDAYSKSLAVANCAIIVCPPFKENDSKNDFMDISIIEKKLRLLGRSVFAVETPEKALETAISQSKIGDVIVFMSNGDFEGIAEKFASL